MLKGEDRLKEKIAVAMEVPGVTVRGALDKVPDAVRPDTGLRFEMQFHTPESREAKELTHQAHERIRSNTASPAEERKLEEFQRRANAYLTAPPGTDRIKDFPE
jgi:hypothetical protein